MRNNDIALKLPVIDQLEFGMRGDCFSTFGLKAPGSCQPYITLTEAERKKEKKNQGYFIPNYLFSLADGRKSGSVEAETHP